MLKNKGIDKPGDSTPSVCSVDIIHSENKIQFILICTLSCCWFLVNKGCFYFKGDVHLLHNKQEMGRQFRGNEGLVKRLFIFNNNNCFNVYWYK